MCNDDTSYHQGALKPSDLYQREVDSVVTKINLPHLAVTLGFPHNPPTMYKSPSVLFMTAKFLGLKENRKERGQEFSLSLGETSDRGKKQTKPA